MFTNKISIEQTNLSNDFTDTDKSELNTAYTNNHTHSNKAILDATTASFTTAQETKLSNTSGVNTGNGISLLGTSSTASATAEKVVVLSGFALATGITIQVKFTNANTETTPTLNVNSTGAKTIYNEAGTAVGANNPAYFPAGSTIEFTYDGTNWIYKKRVVENYVNGTSWYRVYSDGWIEQGGYAQAVDNSTGGSVSLLKTFSNTNYSVLLSSVYPANSTLDLTTGTHAFNYTVSSFSACSAS